MSVFGLVSALAGFVKVRYLIDKAIIDNMIFRCHYRITSALLFVCCIVVTANNLIGNYITGAWAPTYSKHYRTLNVLKLALLYSKIYYSLQAIQYRALMMELFQTTW